MERDRDKVGLEETPTYAIATTSFLFILVSLVVERGIHALKKFLKRKKQKPLRKVLGKLTEELMLLGFISLLLTVLQNTVVKICMPPTFAKHFLPCHIRHFTPEASAPEISPVSMAGRRLLYESYVDQSSNFDLGHPRHLLAQNVTSTGHCSSQGKVPFISLEVLHQLHIFIFVLALTHVCYSLVTVCLGFAKLQRWRRWEEETKVDGFDGTLDLERRYKEILQSEQNYYGRHSNAFFAGNSSCFNNPVSIWIACFFQQFAHSVSREDYLVLRVRFMNNHSLSEPFNFWEYVIRSMQVEFKEVIGISWWLWLFATLLLLLNVRGWDTQFWVAFVPTIMVLVIGTTQQHIIAILALQAKRYAADVIAAESSPGSIPRPTQTNPRLSGSDKLFWFDNSKLVLRLLHFVMFQNSFELAIFFWMVTCVGWNSCILGNHKLLIARLIVGVVTQLIASYSTVPIYSLVTQMGSQMKETVFTKHVYRNLKQWKAKARKISLNRQLERSSFQEDSSQPDITTAIAESSTQASQLDSQSTELTILPEEGTSELAPREPNPELVKRFRKIYGKIVVMQRFKLAAQQGLME
ncbi:unnamed protein product [Calypogeia fissa]